MGFGMGDEGYNTEMERISNQQGDARLNAASQAAMLSGAEASRMHGMDMATRGQEFGESVTGANYANSLRQAAVAEDMQRRGFSLNEINAMLHGQQVAQPSMPSFMGSSRAESPQYLAAAGMQHQGNIDNFNAEQAAAQGLMTGISSFLPWGF